MPTQAEEKTEPSANIEEEMESEDEVEANKDEYEEYDPAYEVPVDDDHLSTEEDDEEFIEEASE